MGSGGMAVFQMRSGPSGVRVRLTSLAALAAFAAVLSVALSWEGSRPASGTSLAPKPSLTRHVPDYQKGPHVTADAAVLMDARTGTVLFGKNEQQRRAPASTTKILTAVLALERARLTDEVTIAPSAAYVGGSQIYLRPGEKMTVEELLKGLMLRSGNDAAVALAEHVSGSERAFADLMTRRARELGALSSTFRNPNGLPAAGHYTTAYDLAMIARRGLELPDFRRIVRSREDVINWRGEGWDRQLMNTNRLLWSFHGADGVKTGTTSEAGQCLVASATRGQWQLISVVLHSDDRWSDSVRLLDWGFANFKVEMPVVRGQEIARAPVVGGVPGEIPLLAGESLPVVVRNPSGSALPRLETRYALDAMPLTAPLAAGEQVGRVWVMVDGEVTAKTDLFAGSSVQHRGRWWRVLGGRGVTGVE